MIEDHDPGDEHQDPPIYYYLPTIEEMKAEMRAYWKRRDEQAMARMRNRS